MLTLRRCPECGVRSHVLDVGRPRCVACGRVFPDEPPAPSADEAESYPLADAGPPPPPEPVPLGGRPLCPRCSRPGAVADRECGYCGFFFGDGVAVRYRRDQAPHRARLVDVLGSVALVAGASALLLGPVGLAVALATGLPALAMSAHDLPKMDTGEVDPSGRRRTEFSRVTSGIGLALGAVLTVAWAVFWLVRLG